MYTFIHRFLRAGFTCGQIFFNRDKMFVYRPLFRPRFCLNSSSYDRNIDSVPGARATKAGKGRHHASSWPKQIPAYGHGSEIDERTGRRFAVARARGKSDGRSLRQSKTQKLGRSRSETEEGTEEIQVEETGEESVERGHVRRRRRSHRFRLDARATFVRSSRGNRLIVL